MSASGIQLLFDFKNLILTNGNGKKFSKQSGSNACLLVTSDALKRRVPGPSSNYRTILLSGPILNGNIDVSKNRDT